MDAPSHPEHTFVSFSWDFLICGQMHARTVNQDRPEAYLRCLGDIRVQHWGTHSLAARLAQRTTSSWCQLGSDLINLWANDSRFRLVEVKVPIKHLLLFVCFRIPFYKLISYMYAQIATDQPNFQGAKWLWVLLVLIFSNLPIHLLEPRWLRGTRAAKARPTREIGARDCKQDWCNSRQ